MDREETRKAAEVMLHFASGGEVEVREATAVLGRWLEDSNPDWDWFAYDYRKAPPKPVKKYVGLYRRVLRAFCKWELTKIIEVEEPAE